MVLSKFWGIFWDNAGDLWILGKESKKDSV